MTVQWRVDGIDSDGRETFLALMCNGRDSEFRVGLLDDGSWALARTAIIGPWNPVLGTYIDLEHAQAAAIRRIGG